MVVTLFEDGARRGTVRIESGVIIQAPALPLPVLRALAEAIPQRRSIVVAGRYFNWVKVQE
jgi:hypothetical protein